MDTKDTPQLDHQKIRAWKIWYSDKTIDSTQMEWVDAPLDDVQVVMVYFEGKDGLGRPTRLYSSGCDVYAMDGDKFSSNFDDPSKVSGIVKHGRFMNYEALAKLEAEAFDDFGEGWLYPAPEVEEVIKDKI